MKLHVYFTPTELTAVDAGPDDIYIVIDVIRATTSMTVMFDQGAARVYAAQSLAQAQQAARAYPHRLLCGERHALPLPGFDFGNSPVQFAQADLQSRELILTTTNGSRAFFACPDTGISLAGCFYNAQAVTAQALRLAQERDSNISLVCSGEAKYFALDDTSCAGYLVLELQRQYSMIRCHESALAAIAIHQAYPPQRLLTAGNSARSVIQAGLREDLDMCIQLSASSSVPVVVGRETETNLLMLDYLGKA